MCAEELHELETVACPGAGACGGQFTANTMSTALEFLGISPAGLNGIPALHRDKDGAAAEAGRLVMRLVRDDMRPSQIVTREAIENATASVAATGGSTNGVLHLLAIARELGIPFEIDDFDAIAARTPVVATSSRAAATSRPTSTTRAASRSSRASCRSAGLLHGDAPNVDGRTLGEIAAAAVESGGPGGRRDDRDAAEAARRLRDPAREPRARGLRAQALRPRARDPPRPGARLRLRGGLLRRGQGASGSAPATSS